MLDNHILAQKVADVYEQKSRTMDGGISLLLVGALVVLAINLKEIRIVKEKHEMGEQKGMHGVLSHI